MRYLLRYFSKSSVATLSIKNPYGLHLRPSTHIVTTAKKFTSTVEIHHGTDRADAKNLHQLLGLNLAFGDTITIKGFGKDSKEAVNQLSTLLQNQDEIHETSSKTPKHKYAGKVLEGKAICGGIAIGSLWYMPIQEMTTAQENIKETFLEAKKRVLAHLLEKTNPIFQAHYALIEALQATTFESLHQEIKEHIATLKEGANSSKIDDYYNILKYFQGTNETLQLPSEPTIVVAHKLLPSDIEAIAKSSIKGVIATSYVAPNSHVALLLRSHQIPAIHLQRDCLNNLELKSVIVDGFSGVLVTSLTQEDRAFALSWEQNDNQKQQVAFEKRLLSATTKEGKNIEVVANIQDFKSAQEAKKYGATKVGLLRSEFIFKEDKPTLQEQINFYQEIFELFKEVTVRTLDVGGDKQLPYITIPQEQNPFLGIRGIRLLQTHREIISKQLEAILIASKGKKVKIMFPMVATVDEFLDGKNLAIELSKKLNIDCSNISFGIMIEIPCVVFMLSQFNELVDFYSIGTNDLHQYLFAVDRTHPSFKIDGDELIFEVVKHIVKNATKPVSICGELAGDIDKIDKLLQTDINTLSVAPKMIPAIKERIRNV